MKMPSHKEDKLKRISPFYYSRPEIQKAIYEFSKNREICPRYFDSFGKRPDSFQYPSDIYEMSKKGATSFNCSEELWSNPLEIKTGMNPEQLNKIRIGWDLLIDIDSKYIDYSKICAKIIIDFLKKHEIKNIGLKFSGSKGFHIIIPWSSLPKKVGSFETKNMFPEWARIIIKYITEHIKEQLTKKISDLERPNKYVKDFQAPKEVMPDIIAVSPRHLIRMPYSLHEKTALASIVINPEKILEFDLKDADPLKISKENIKNFLPETETEEAKELLREALDWSKHYHSSQEKQKENFVKKEYSSIKFENSLEKNFPPSIKKILQGMADGKKRALFILVNFFLSIGMPKEEMEKRIYEWDKKNQPPLGERYIKPHLLAGYKNKIVPPPNFDKDYYKGIGIIPSDEEIRYKNPLSYFVKKSFRSPDKFAKPRKKKHS